MATTGSHLEALSAFTGFISSYLALMRVVSTVTQSKASIFLFVSIFLAVEYEPQYLQSIPPAGMAAQRAAIYFFTPYRSWFTRDA